MIADFLQALKGFCDVKIYMPISILSNLFTKTENHNHYHSPIILKIDDEEKALRIAKECPNVHVAVERDTEITEVTNDKK
jgi:hypothetical protein